MHENDRETQRIQRQMELETQLSDLEQTANAEMTQETWDTLAAWAEDWLRQHRDGTAAPEWLRRFYDSRKKRG